MPPQPVPALASPASREHCRQSGVSGGMGGNGTHQGGKGGALTVSVQGVRAGLAEKVTWSASMVNTGERNLGTAFQPDRTASAGDI